MVLHCWSKSSAAIRRGMQPSLRAHLSIGSGSAFHAHDYQTAAFFFDAAMSEDFEYHPGRKDGPAQLFMVLDDTNQKQAARDIVALIVGKLDRAVADYVRRENGNLTTNDVRKRFLRYVLEQNKPRLRSLTTTLLSFLAEWDYRLRTIDLSHLVGSREPFFTHLLRGCLLFESLIKENPKEIVLQKRSKLETVLNQCAILQALGIEKVCTSKSEFDQILRSLKSDEPLQAAIQCTLDVRNRLAHRLGLEGKSLDRENYELLANNIAASCLHVIACLYRPLAPNCRPEPEK